MNTIELPPEARQILDQRRDELAAAELPAGLSPETETALNKAINTSFVAGFRQVMLVAAGLALSSAVIAAFMID